MTHQVPADTQPYTRALTDAGYMPVAEYVRLCGDMWTHYCIVDRAWISVGKGEPCNWCGKCERKITPLIDVL